jgi:hypothetical protein
VSPVTRGAQRLRKRARAAHFKRQVDPTPLRDFKDPFFPGRIVR